MTQKDWFRSWFNTPYYRKLYKHRGAKDAQVFIDALLDRLDLNQGADVLDLACGRGRHAMYLDQKGFNVSGYDLSEDCIAFAKTLNSNVDFQVKDMRIPFGKNKFECIFNLFTSFGYFESREENFNVVQNISSALKPDGILILDFLNAHKVGKGLVKDELVESGALKFRIKRYVDNNKIVKEIQVKDGEEELQFFESVALLTESDFKELFENCGLKLLNTFGDFELNPYSQEDSDRLILMAQRLC